MPNLKSLTVQLKSVKNMQAITKSMKVVSAVKYSRAEKELKPVRPIGEASRVFYKQAEIVPLPDLPQNIFIGISSDRGLCGAVNFNVSKMIRNELVAPHENDKVVVVGDKGRFILEKSHPKNILLACNKVGKKTAVFVDAAKITAALLNSGYEFNTGNIVYNKFVSVSSYVTSMIPFFGYLAILHSPYMAFYDDVDSEVVLSYLEFSLSCMIYHAIKENAVSEQAARMTSMDTASKSAEKMMGKIGQTVNRSRQANITRDLIEVISGAMAMEIDD